MKLAFIVGTGRCGSSLIHEILARHEGVGFVSNIDDNLPRLNLKGRWNGTLYRTPLGRLTRKGAWARFAPSEAYKLIASQVSPVYANSSRDLETRDVTPWLAQRFREFFEERARQQGADVFLHKYTGWSRIGFFAEIFPEARFIHVVRDGRAVANSWLQMPWWNGYRGPENWFWGNLTQPYLDEWNASDRSYTRLAAIAWKVLMDSHERASQDLSGERYLQLRYEDFLREPHGTLQQIVSFIGLPWTVAFERHVRQQKIDASRSRAFERDLSPDQLVELQSSLSEKLRQYGYATESARSGCWKPGDEVVGFIEEAS
jgi:hypothetical protein